MPNGPEPKTSADLARYQDSFRVRQFANDFVIEMSYERDLDLFFSKKVITYETSLALR